MGEEGFTPRGNNMNEKKFPLTKEETLRLIERYPTPFHLYDEAKIRANFRRLRETFAWAPSFREHFAVKALPNPRIVQLLHDDGAGTDCSSIPELIISAAAGVKGEEIMLTSNDTPYEEFQKAIELGAVINLDDLSHLDYMAKHAGLPNLLCFRYNPGNLVEGNDIIGKPVEAKYGLTREPMFEGYRRALEMGVKRFGVHTMVISAELRTEAFLLTARLMFELAAELKEKLGIHVEFVNLGGGFGIPYRPEQDGIDYDAVGAGIEKLYNEIMRPAGLGDVGIRTESARGITGDAGWLVSTVLHEKDTYKKYIGLDSCMANLMRPAIYGAYHHITILGKENEPADHVYDVTGSLCENNDKFAIDRALPKIDIGDILIIHDTGAHGSAMGFNYNAKLHCAELLRRMDGSIELIRRPQTIDDYFATLKYEGSLMK